MKRVSLAGLLGFIALIAVGLAALVNGTGLWAGIIFSTTFGLLFAGILVVILRGRREAAWVGLVVFGWGFVLLDYLPRVAEQGRQISGGVADWVFRRANPEPNLPPPSPGVSAWQSLSDHRIAMKPFQNRLDHARAIGHWLLVLLHAQVGAILGGMLTRARTPGGATAPSSTPPAGTEATDFPRTR